MRQELGEGSKGEVEEWDTWKEEKKKGEGTRRKVK